MRKHTAARAAACLVALVAAGLWPAMRVAGAADCVASPQESAPAGYHWYYRTDRRNSRKCWYLRKADTQAVKKPSPRAQQGAHHANDQSSSPSRKQRLDREALFKDFLRWQKQQDTRP